MLSLLSVMFGVLLVSGAIQTTAGDFFDGLGRLFSDLRSTFIKNLAPDCTKVKYFLGLLFPQMTIAHHIPDTSNIKLRLYTDTKMVDFYLSLGGAQILDHPLFNISMPTVIYSHGFMSKLKGKSVSSLTNALIKKGGLNVFALDSSSIILRYYLRASTCVVFIGNLLGKTLADMYNGGAGVDLKKMRIIGHSLGAHISGYAGKTFKNLTGMTFSRITGMDPAGPCFFTKGSDHRLNSNDAEFVDIIHSDAGTFGLIEPIGHADFYPNNGLAQPHCFLLGCSHSRSWELYRETIIKEDIFLAIACGSWEKYLIGDCADNVKAYMGYGLSTDTRGIFYLKTAGFPPYTYNLASNTKKNQSTLKAILYFFICLFVNKAYF